MATIRKFLILLIAGASVCLMSIPSVTDARHTEMNLDESAALSHCDNVLRFYELDEYSDEKIYGTASPSDLAYLGARIDLAAAFEEIQKEVVLFLLMKIASKVDEELLLSLGTKVHEKATQRNLALLGLVSVINRFNAMGLSDQAEMLRRMYLMDMLDSDTLADLKEQGLGVMIGYGHKATNILKHLSKTAKGRKPMVLGTGLLVMMGTEIVALAKQCREAD